MTERNKSVPMETLVSTFIEMHGQGKTGKEIAAALGMNHGSFNTALSQARNAIRNNSTVYVVKGGDPDSIVTALKPLELSSGQLDKLRERMKKNGDTITVKGIAQVKPNEFVECVEGATISIEGKQLPNLAKGRTGGGRDLDDFTENLPL